jgi:hypothetical protein
MGTILITSRLGSEYHGDLELVLFFNPKQHKAEAGILNSIELYGVPEIMTENGYFRIRINPFTVAQTLFSIDRTSTDDVLAGALVYVRDAIDDLSVLHIAIASNYSLKGPITSARLLWGLLHQVTEAAARISGVRNVKLVYGKYLGKGKDIINNIPVTRRVKKTLKPVLINPAKCPDEAITCYEYQRCYASPQKIISKTRGPIIQKATYYPAVIYE